MPTPVDELVVEALDLPAKERAKLLELLISGFEPKSRVQQSWTQLALRRRDEVREGKVAMRPGPQAMQRVRARIA